MVKSFLHLEDIHGDPGLQELFDGPNIVSSSDEILPVIHDFYQHLYETSDIKPLNVVEDFLQNLDLPCISHDTTALVQPISSGEVADAIKKLQLGKAPGLDGLSADFYKHFIDRLSSILAVIFNQIFEDRVLTSSQKLAVIILLFKKGDP